MTVSGTFFSSASASSLLGSWARFGEFWLWSHSEISCIGSGCHMSCVDDPGFEKDPRLGSGFGLNQMSNSSNRALSICNTCMYVTVTLYVTATGTKARREKRIYQKSHCVLCECLRATEWWVEGRNTPIYPSSSSQGLVWDSPNHQSFPCWILNQNLDGNMDEENRHWLWNSLLSAIESHTHTFQAWVKTVTTTIASSRHVWKVRPLESVLSGNFSKFLKCCERLSHLHFVELIQSNGLVNLTHLVQCTITKSSSHGKHRKNCEWCPRHSLFKGHN